MVDRLVNKPVTPLKMMKTDSKTNSIGGMNVTLSNQASSMSGLNSGVVGGTSTAGLSIGNIGNYMTADGITGFLASSQ
jgi:hypothetical protein